MKKKRINNPITVTITPESHEAIEILKEESSKNNLKDKASASSVVDSAIKEAVVNRKFTLKETKMFVAENKVTVELIHDGKALERHEYNGQNFIQAPESGNFIIKLTNNSFKRKLVVTSVDGLNIMDGKSAGYDGSGYVLDPLQTIEIIGWRRTDKEVASFKFVGFESSYDKQIGGSGKNIGVIGAAVFDEFEKFTFWELPPYSNLPYYMRQDHYNENSTYDMKNIINYIHTNDSSFIITNTNTSFSTLIGPNDLNNDFLKSECISSYFVTEPAEDSSGEISILGTGYGEKQVMNTIGTEFIRASTDPAYIITLLYNSKSALKKLGVIDRPAIPTVNPFPEEKASVKAPPDWVG